MKLDDHKQGSGDRVSIVLLLLSLPVGLFSCFVLPNPVVAAVFLGMFVATGMHKFIEPIWYLKKQLTFVIKVGESKDGFWWWHEPKCVQNFSLKTCIAPSKHYFFQPPTLS